MDDAGELLTRHKLTVDDYYHMTDVGILNPRDRLELINGEIIDMAPVGVGHASVVGRITRALIRACGNQALVWVQNPVRLDQFNEPQPDFAVLKPRADFYETQHPAPSDILLLIEVSDSSLRYDRDVKLPLYARSGIPEFWIVDVQRRVVESHRVPSSEGFAEDSLHRHGDTIHLAAAPELSPLVDDLLGAQRQNASDGHPE